VVCKYKKGRGNFFAENAAACFAEWSWRQEEYVRERFRLSRFAYREEMAGCEDGAISSNCRAEILTKLRSSPSSLRFQNEFHAADSFRLAYYVA
jgi:hypothetical protein